MVVFDKQFEEFSKNYTKYSDSELLDFRRDKIKGLFAGEVNSQCYEERKALIELTDKEIERRFKKRTETISVFSIIISVAAIIISIIK